MTVDVGTVVALCLALGGGIAVVWSLVASNRHRRIVMQSSTALSSLKLLNEQWATRLTYPPAIKHEWVDWANSKAQMDRYNLTSLLWHNLAAYEGHFDTQIQAQVEAMTAHLEYLEACTALGRDLLGSSGSPSMKQGRYDRLESKLFARQRLPTFSYQARIRCEVRYTSPKGQNSYWRFQEWDFEGLFREFQQMRQVRAEQSTTKFLRQQERQRVTASVRYEVFARDGHRCRVCGNTAEVEPLHVDHIIPISRGGRSDMDNLQTLCQTCNLGKSDRH